MKISHSSPFQEPRCQRLSPFSHVEITATRLHGSTQKFQTKGVMSTAAVPTNPSSGSPILR